jgi:hypothetical protein
MGRIIAYASRRVLVGRMVSISSFLDNSHISLMGTGKKDEQIACHFWTPGLSSGNPMSEGGDAPEDFANEELLPVIRLTP